VAKIHVCQISEVVRSLPEIQPFNPTGNNLDEKADLFFCALGFEPRCLFMPSALAQHGFSATRARYFRYATNQDDNETNRSQLVQHLSAISDDVQALESDETGFSTQLRELLASVTAHTEDKEPIVILDLSVVANRLLMRCFKILLEFNIHLKILYSEAVVYHPTQEEYEREPQKWTSDEALGIERGISDVGISEEYPGYHIDPLPDCVILFSNIKKVRNLAIISKVDSSLITSPGNKVVWLLGVPHAEQDQWLLGAMREINNLGPDTPHYEVSTFDYRDALGRLDAIYQERVEQYKITLSPMGSNMQAVGAALFCYLRPAVRVIFAVPEEYNALQYSEGCQATWMIDFGSMRKLREQLDNVDMISIEE
jgi:hypothetical protein